MDETSVATFLRSNSDYRQIQVQFQTKALPKSEMHEISYLSDQECVG